MNSKKSWFKTVSAILILAFIQFDIAWANGGSSFATQEGNQTLRPLAARMSIPFELQDRLQAAIDPTLHARIHELIGQLDIDDYLPRSELRASPNYKSFLEQEIRGSLGPIIMETIQSGEITPPPLELPMPVPITQIADDLTPKEKILTALEAILTMMDETDRAVLQDFKTAIDEALEGVFQKAKRERNLTVERLSQLLTTDFKSAYHVKMKAQLKHQLQQASQMKVSERERALHVNKDVSERYQRIPRFVKWLLSGHPELSSDREVLMKLGQINTRLNQLPEVPNEIVAHAIEQVERFIRENITQERKVAPPPKVEQPRPIERQAPAVPEKPKQSESELLKLREEESRVKQTLEAKRREEGELLTALAELSTEIKNEKEEVVLKALNKAKTTKASLLTKVQSEIETLERREAELQERLSRSELRTGLTSEHWQRAVDFMSTAWPYALGLLVLSVAAVTVKTFASLLWLSHARTKLNKASFKVTEALPNLIRFKKPDFRNSMSVAVVKLLPTFFLGWVWGGFLLWMAYHNWNWDEIKLYTWEFEQLGKKETSSITVTGLLWIVEIFVTPFLHIGLVALLSMPVVLTKEIIFFLIRLIIFPWKLKKALHFDVAKATELSDSMVKDAAKVFAEFDTTLLLKIFESWKQRNENEKTKRLLSSPLLQGRHEEMKYAIEHEELKDEVRELLKTRGDEKVLDQIAKLEKRAGLQKTKRYQEFDHAVRLFLEDDWGIKRWVEFLLKVPERSLSVVIRDIDHVVRARSMLDDDGDLSELPEALAVYERKRGAVSSLTESFIVGLLTPKHLPIEERIKTALKYDDGIKLAKLGLPGTLTDLNEPVSLDEFTRAVGDESRIRSEFGSHTLSRMISKMGRDGLYTYYEAEHPPYYLEFLEDTKDLMPGFNRPEEKFRVAYDSQDVKDSSLEPEMSPITSTLQAAKDLIKVLRTKYPSLYDNFIGPKREILKGKPLDEALDEKSVRKVTTLFIQKISSWDLVPEPERANLFVKALEILSFEEAARDLGGVSASRKAASYWKGIRTALKNQNHVSQNSKLYALIAKLIDSKIERLEYEETAGRKGVMQFYLSGKTFVDFFRGCVSSDCTARHAEEGTIGKFDETMATVPDPAFFLFKIIENNRWIGNIYSLIAKDKDGKTYLFIDMLSVSPAHSMTSEQKKQMANRFFEAIALWAGEAGLDGVILSNTASQREDVGSPLKTAAKEFSKEEAKSFTLRKAGGNGYFAEFGLHEEYVQNFGGEATSGFRSVSGFLISPKQKDHELERVKIQAYRIHETVSRIREEGKRLREIETERKRAKSILEEKIDKARRERKRAVEDALRSEHEEVQVAVDRIGLELGELQGKIRENESRLQTLEARLNGHARSELRTFTQPMLAQDALSSGLLVITVLGGALFFIYLIWEIIKRITMDDRHTDIPLAVPLSYFYTKPELQALLHELNTNLALVLAKVPEALKDRFGVVKPVWERQGKIQIEAIQKALQVLKDHDSVFTFIKGTDFYRRFKDETGQIGIKETFDEPGARIPLKGRSNAYLELSTRTAEDLYRGDVSCDCTSFTEGTAFFETIPQFLFDPGFLNFKVVVNGKWIGNIYVIVAKSREGKPVIVIDAIQISPWSLKKGTLKPLSESVVHAISNWAKEQDFTEVFMSRFVSNFYQLYQILDPLYPTAPIYVEKVSGFDHLKELGLWDGWAYRNQYLETFSPRWNHPLPVRHNESKGELLLRAVYRSELRNKTAAEPKPVVLIRKDGIQITMPPRTEVEKNEGEESFKALTPQRTKVEGSLNDGAIEILTAVGLLGVLNPTSLFSLAGYKFVLPALFKITFTGAKLAQITVGEKGLVKYDHDQKAFEISNETDSFTMTDSGEIKLPWMDEPLQIPKGSIFKIEKDSITIETPDHGVYEIKKPQEREAQPPKVDLPRTRPALHAGAVGFGAQVLQNIEAAFEKEKERKLLEKFARVKREAEQLKNKLREGASLFGEQVNSLNSSSTPKELVEQFLAIREQMGKELAERAKSIREDLGEFKDLPGFQVHLSEAETLLAEIEAEIKQADDLLHASFQKKMRDRAEKTKTILKAKADDLLQNSREAILRTRALSIDTKPKELAGAIDRIKEELVRTLQKAILEMDSEANAFNLPALQEISTELLAYYESLQTGILGSLQVLWEALDEPKATEAPILAVSEEKVQTKPIQLTEPSVALPLTETGRTAELESERKKRVAHLREQARQRIKTLRSLKAREKELQENIARLQASVREVETNLGVQTEKIESGRARLLEIAQFVADKESWAAGEIAKLEAKVKELGETTPELAAVQAKINGLKDEEARLMGENESLGQTIARLQRENESLSNKKTELAGETGRLQNQIRTLDEQVSSKREEVSGIERTIHERQAESERLQKSIGILKAEQIDLARRLEFIAGQVSDFSETLATLKEETDALEAKKNVLTAEIESLQVKKGLRIDTARLTKRLREYLQIPSGSGREKTFRDRLLLELTQLGGHEVKLPRLQKPLNLIWDIPITADYQGSVKKIGLNAHIDRTTHNTSDVSMRHGILMVEGNRGNAGLDDALGVAAIMEVLLTMKEKNIPHPQIRIIFTVEEERGFVGARDIVDHHPEILKDLDFLVPIDGPLLDKESQRHYRGGPPSENVLPLAVKFINFDDSRALRESVHEVGTGVGQVVWEALASGIQSGMFGVGASFVKHQPAEFAPSGGDEQAFERSGVRMVHLRANYDHASGHVPQDSVKLEHFVLLTEWLLRITESSARSELRMFPPPPSDDDFLYPHQPEGGVNDFSDMEDVFKVTDYLREHQDTDIAQYVISRINKGQNLILWNYNGPTPWILKDLGKIIRELLEQKKITQIHLDFPTASQALVDEFLRRGNVSPELIRMIESRFPPFLPREFKRPDLYLEILRQVHEFNIDQPDQKKIRVIAYYDKTLPPMPDFSRRMPLLPPPNPFENRSLERIVRTVSELAGENPQSGYLIIKPLEDGLPISLRRHPRILSMLHIDKHTGFGPQKPENKLALYMSQQASDNQKSFALPILPGAPFYNDEINAIPKNLPIPRQGFNEFKNYPHLVMSTGSEDEEKDGSAGGQVPIGRRVKSPSPMGPRSELRKVLYSKEPVIQRRENAVRELVHIGKPAVPALIQTFRNPSITQRLGAIESLGAIGDTQAISPLQVLSAALEFRDASRAAIEMIRAKNLNQPEASIVDAQVNLVSAAVTREKGFKADNVQFIRSLLEESPLAIDLDAETFIEKSDGKLSVKGIGFMESVKEFRRLLPDDLLKRLQITIINLNPSFTVSDIEQAFQITSEIKGIIQVRNVPIRHENFASIKPFLDDRSIRVAYEGNLKLWDGNQDILVKSTKPDEVIDGRKLFLAAILHKRLKSQLTQEDQLKIEKLLQSIGTYSPDGGFIFTGKSRAQFDLEFLSRFDQVNQMLARAA